MVPTAHSLGPLPCTHMRSMLQSRITYTNTIISALGTMLYNDRRTGHTNYYYSVSTHTHTQQDCVPRVQCPRQVWLLLDEQLIPVVVPDVHVDLPTHLRFVSKILANLYRNGRTKVALKDNLLEAPPLHRGGSVNNSLSSRQRAFVT